MKLIKTIIYFTLLIVMSSCSSSKLITYSVAYQSVRPVTFKPEIPNDATIAVGYSFDCAGQIVVFVQNMTDEIMIIDQTKSYCVNSDGLSHSYYDPTVRSTTTTTSEANTNGASVNLGAIGGFLGIGGPVGSLLSGINVGESNTIGSSNSTTAIFADMPQISLAPKSMGEMSKRFQISGVGYTSLAIKDELNKSYSPQNSYCTFSVCISYSIDNGATFKKIVTPFYVNSLVASPVTTHGQVNAALRKLLQSKPDALNEPWWLIYANQNNYISNDFILQGSISDYQ